MEDITQKLQQLTKSRKISKLIYKHLIKRKLVYFLMSYRSRETERFQEVSYCYCGYAQNVIEMLKNAFVTDGKSGSMKYKQGSEIHEIYF